MFEILDRRTSLTGNQIKILTAAIIGDALEFFDYFLIGFVLAFLIGPWKLTFGQSAIVLMSSGIGAIIGAYVWGWLADRIGRRSASLSAPASEGFTAWTCRLCRNSCPPPSAAGLAAS
jgi:putative MFS transporter